MRNLLILSLSSILFASGAASAGVYKCTAPNGKILYSDAPCALSDKTSRQQTLTTAVAPANAEPAPLSSRDPDWLTDEKLIAYCEANRGIHCSAPDVIRQIREESVIKFNHEQRQAEQRVRYKENKQKEERLQAEQRIREDNLRKAKDADPLSDKQLIANCEANRGVNCSNPDVIRENRKDNTPLTLSERLEAAADRRSRENAAFMREAERRSHEPH